MPEYLAPGVFVEEVSFRAKSIEGVPTSTTGMAGRTRFGPVQYQGGPTDSEPRLITSFVEFERLYGKLDQLDGDVTPVLAHAARAFFLNGGQRLYVSRVHAAGLADAAGGVASGTVPQTLPAGTTATAIWHARWPGRMGNVLVEVRPMRSRNVAVKAELGDQGPLRANRARNGALVEVVPAASPMPKPDAPLSADKLRVVSVDNAGRQSFSGGTGAITAGDRLLLVELEVLVRVDPERVDRTVQMGCHPNHRRYIGDVLHRDHPEDDTGVVWLDPMGADAIVLAVALTGAGADPAVGRFELGGGNDGVMPTADQLLGKEADPDHAEIKATGLTALGEIEDIAIVAMPDAGCAGRRRPVQAATHLIQHAERLRLPDRHRRRAEGARRSPRSASSAASSTRPAPRSTTRGSRSSTRLQPADAGRAADRDRAAAVRASWRASTRARDIERGVLQGAGQRGRARAHAVRGEHQHRPPAGAQPRGHQRPAVLRGPWQPGLGRAHDELGPRVEVRQRPAAVHVPRALDRQVDAVGGVRAQRRARCGRTIRRPVEDFLLDVSGATARCSAPRPSRRTSCVATARR